MGLAASVTWFVRVSYIVCRSEPIPQPYNPRGEHTRILTGVWPGNLHQTSFEIVAASASFCGVEWKTEWPDVTQTVSEALGRLRSASVSSMFNNRELTISEGDAGWLSPPRPIWRPVYAPYVSWGDGSQRSTSHLLQNIPGTTWF